MRRRALRKEEDSCPPALRTADVLHVTPASALRQAKKPLNPSPRGPADGCAQDLQTERLEHREGAGVTRPSREVGADLGLYRLRPEAWA